jgi:hypothetical protein
MSRVVTPWMGVGLVLAIACHAATGPGFEVDRLPETAYLTPDAAPPPDGGPREGGAQRDSGALRLVMPSNCVAAPARPPSDDEAASDFPECPNNKGERLYFDGQKTQRVRDKMQRTVCCYSVPQNDYGGE